MDLTRPGHWNAISDHNMPWLSQEKRVWTVTLTSTEFPKLLWSYYGILVPCQCSAGVICPEGIFSDLHYSLFWPESGCKQICKTIFVWRGLYIYTLPCGASSKVVHLSRRELFSLKHTFTFLGLNDLSWVSECVWDCGISSCMKDFLPKVKGHGTQIMKPAHITVHMDYTTGCLLQLCCVPAPKFLHRFGPHVYHVI